MQVVKLDEEFPVSARDDEDDPNKQPIPGGLPPIPSAGGYVSKGAPMEPATGVDPLDQNPITAVGLPGPTPSQPPAAPPGGTLTPLQLAQLAVPSDRPGGELAAPGTPDDVDQVLAANPIPGPPPPSATPELPPGPVDIADQERQLLNANAQSTNAKIAARQKQGGVEAQAAAEQAQLAQENEQRLKREQAESEQATAQANAITQQWVDKYQAQSEKRAQMGLHDPVDDMATWQKVLAGLSITIGGLAGPNNPGMKMVKDALDRNFRLQQAKIENQNEIVAGAREGMQGSMSQKQQKLLDLKMKHADAYDAAAAKLTTLRMRQGQSAAQAKTDADVAELHDQANKERLEGFQALHKLEMDAAHLAIEKQKADAEKIRADAYAAAQGRKGKHGGGGGGGTDAFSRFVAAAGELKPGDPIPPELAVLGRHAGLKPNQVAAEVDRYRGSGAKAETAAGKAANAGLAGDRLLSKEAEAWGKSNGLPAVIKKQTELSSVLDEINNAPHNPLQQALAIEKAVSSARGGAASRQALDLALHHLGGKWDSIQALVQGAKSGEVGPKQMDNFIGFMNNQLGTAQKEGKDKYDAFGKYVESQPPAKRDALIAERGRLFSGLAGFGGEAAPPRAPSGKPLPGGNRIVRVRDNQTGDIIEAIKRPDGSLINKQTGQPLQ